VSEVNYSLADYLSDVTALKAERDAAVRERDEAFQQLEEHGRHRLKAAHWKREYDRLAAIVERVKALSFEWRASHVHWTKGECASQLDRALAQPVERAERRRPQSHGDVNILISGGNRIYPHGDGMWGPDRRRAGSGK